MISFLSKHISYLKAFTVFLVSGIGTTTLIETNHYRGFYAPGITFGLALFSVIYFIEKIKQKRIFWILLLSPLSYTLAFVFWFGSITGPNHSQFKILWELMPFIGTLTLALFLSLIGLRMKHALLAIVVGSLCDILPRLLNPYLLLVDFLPIALWQISVGMIIVHNFRGQSKTLIDSNNV